MSQTDPNNKPWNKIADASNSRRIDLTHIRKILHSILHTYNDQSPTFLYTHLKSTVNKMLYTNTKGYKNKANHRDKKKKHQIYE